MDAKQFQNTIRSYYKKHGRDLPWRRTRDSYKILVSEIMLQQTQAERVVPKYRSFLKKFPTVRTLAEAELGEVLREWQGLGYNRRAVYLKRCAEQVVKEFSGQLPNDFKSLCTLPGIGPATAGDLMVFAWDLPAVVIETNIRSVFIHFFFKDKENIKDSEILPLIERTLPKKNYREWYYALFDYGVYLKRGVNPSRRSAHYTKQSPFAGSHRQKRAAILRSLLQKPHTAESLMGTLDYESALVTKILADLQKEGLVKKMAAGRYAVA